ncbi:hypothetical protein N9048_02340 [bacterium]|nr:hypothetical protein [bacterium]
MKNMLFRLDSVSRASGNDASMKINNPRLQRDRNTQLPEKKAATKTARTVTAANMVRSEKLNIFSLSWITIKINRPPY